MNPKLLIADEPTTALDVAPGRHWDFKHFRPAAATSAIPLL
ncbi:hypothetical protein ACFWP0_06165 [Achromobacter sp. NPDC058515]